MAHQRILEFSTFGRGSRDISAAVSGVVAESDIRCGLAQVFVQHTSCSLLITENADPDVRHDLETIIRRLVPDGDPAYRHDTEGPDDMAAHARSMLTATGLSVPVGAGGLLLGTWQGIFLWEHRVGEHRRKVVVTVIGD
jgi:secondary thiamine-phosphate synthase enzyme